MGILSLLRRRKETLRLPEGIYPDSTAVALLWGMRSDIDQLRSRLHTIDIALEGHHDRLKSHEEQMSEHQEHVQTLEQTLTDVSPSLALSCPQTQGIHARSKLVSTGPTQQFDISRFTEQQKRILSVFFQNKGVRMSYVDVAAALNKSAYTVKNQLNQIRQKADLFDCSIGDQSRKLFALKGDLRIEKYLHLGQPVDRPRSIVKSDASQTQGANIASEGIATKPQ